MTREAPREFRKLLRDFDATLDCRWDPVENTWVIWRQSRGRWLEEIVLGREDPGEWVIRYLQERDVFRRFGKGWRGYRQWLRERAQQREATRRQARRDAIRDVIHDNWRKILPAMRDDIQEQTAFTVQGLKREG